MSERFKPENESGKEFDFAEEFSIGNIQHKLIPESPKVELKGVKNYNLGEGISLRFLRTSRMRSFMPARTMRRRVKLLGMNQYSQIIKIK